MNVKMIATVLLLVLLLAGGFFAYVVFFQQPDASLLVSTSSDDGRTSDVTQLLGTLRTLQTLRIDTDLLEDPAFRYLQDFSIDIEAVPLGRSNPFTPF